MGEYSANAILEQIQTLAIIRYGKGKLKEMIIDNGLKYSVIDNLRKGSMLSADKLAKIADALGCSTDYLLGRASLPALPDDIFADMQLDPLESTMIELFRKLSEEEQSEIVSAVNDYMLKHELQSRGVHQEIKAGRDNYGSNIATLPQYSDDDKTLFSLIKQLPLVERSELICKLAKSARK